MLKKVVNHVLTRDTAKIAPGQSAYGAVPGETGTVCDDAIVANRGGNSYLHCHGAGDNMNLLTESAKGLDADIELDDELHNIAFQGPASLTLLIPHTPLNLGELGYFEHVETEIFGHSCRLSRSGYSGERGYEILAGSSIGKVQEELTPCFPDSTKVMKEFGAAAWL